MATFDGLPVIDATRGLELHVEKRDVDRRQRKNEAKCALATCVTRVYKTEARVFMSRAYVMSQDKTHWVRYVVGGTAQREITAFDRGAPFEPGVYRLSPPAPANRLGNGDKSPKTRPTPSGKVVRPHHVSINVRRRSPLGGTGDRS